MLKNWFRPGSWWSFKAFSRLITLSLLSSFLTSVPFAFAADPVISTSWTIANGAESPPIYLDGTGFAPDNDKFDFTVDVGSTGLEYDSVAYVDPSHMRFNFHGIANAGTITIQANTSAFSPVASEPSNTISLVVPIPLLTQSITFTTPSSMKVKDPDQSPKATATSGLPVVLVSNKPSVCTIDFLKIHAVAAGTCSITATQNGDSKYAVAQTVERTFTIIGLDPVVPSEPNPPVTVVTNLGSSLYDPNATNNTYVSVLVAAQDLSEENAVLVKLLVPPGATNTSVVFLISSLSTDTENAAGYFVARIRASAPDGTPSLKLKKPIEINIPAGAIEGVPAWSLDGQSWYKLKRIETEVLPSDLHAGYFVESDGRIAIFTDYLMLFGYRKPQAPLKISAPSLSIETNFEVQLSHEGGSGLGEVKFFTRSNEFCIVTPSGVLKGVKAGKCLVAANKNSHGIHMNAAASAITIYVQDAQIVSGHPTNDPNHAVLCQELSYTRQKSSALVFVNLCAEDKGKVVTLEIGTKSTAGVWSFSVAGKQVLDGNGVTLFRLSNPIKVGQLLRIKAEGKVQISTVISGTS